MIALELTFQNVSWPVAAAHWVTSKRFPLAGHRLPQRHISLLRLRKVDLPMCVSRLAEFGEGQSREPTIAQVRDD